MISRVIVAGLLVSGASLMSTAAHAVVVSGTSISVSLPAGTNHSSGAYADDVYLESIVAGNATFATHDSFRAISRFEVLTGRNNINAEWGDLDTGSDGDDTPFAKAGFAGQNQETTDPTIQDAALLNAFNSLSLTEMSDGESSGFSFRAMFSASLTDDDLGVDSTPEIMLFERGMNDIFDVRLIIGGTFEAPVYSNTLTVDSSTFWNTGISVDTVEISRAQNIGFGGFDLNDFGLSGGESVFGMEVIATGGGPDLNAFVLSSVDPSRFGTPLTPVPLPAGLPLLATALAATAALRRRRRAD